MSKKIRKYDFASLLQIEYTKRGKEISYQDCIDFINVFQDTILDLLCKDYRISFVNFGKFVVDEYDKKFHDFKTKKVKTRKITVPKLYFYKKFKDKRKEKRQTI
jgi:nucleoid DNA-binding protein